MVIDQGRTDILEHIRAQAGLSYLSDLHGGQNNPSIVQAIAQIPDCSFTSEEWQLAASYILRKKVPLAAPSATKALVIERLSDSGKKRC